MSNFRTRAKLKIGHQSRPAATLKPIVRNVVRDSRLMLADRPANAKMHAQEARKYTLEHLEELHTQLRESCERNGITYHRTASAEEACALISEIIGPRERIAKSKSMVAEEIGLTNYLRKQKKEVFETDIGEYIVDIEGQGPSHVTAPAIHLDRHRIQNLLNQAGLNVPDNSPLTLSHAVRNAVSDFFQNVDVGITGANAVIASSGRIMVVENEGNVALGLSTPPIHIAVTGIEKVVQNEQAALDIAQVLAPSATAQPLTAYTHFISTPTKNQERHLVFVDAGRTDILKDERYREILLCIRCGACMNACPVYTAANGLSYGSPYMGPIGAVLSPLLWPENYSDLPDASSLCGRCSEVCPVGIPLHDMLLDLRADAADKKASKKITEKIVWLSWSFIFSKPHLGQGFAWLTKKMLRLLKNLHQQTPLDPRRVPGAKRSRDTEMLIPLFEKESIPSKKENFLQPSSLLEQFNVQATEVGFKIENEGTARLERCLVLKATGAIAATGSVIFVEKDPFLKKLMEAANVTIMLEKETIVKFPSDAENLIGKNENALIMTGASRTADIEKKIVRGIHGPQNISVVIK
tara:strand:+ start:7169 stop:8911 length:1743 start_codon:yes stop_codon:yes gene_type:complete